MVRLLVTFSRPENVMYFENLDMNGCKNNGEWFDGCNLHHSVDRRRTQQLGACRWIYVEIKQFDRVFLDQRLLRSMWVDSAQTKRCEYI
jgi:hypothetical protein